MTTDRRTFGKRALAAGLVVGASGGSAVRALVRESEGGFEPYAFEIEHDVSVKVIIGNGEHFTVTVSRDGDVVEEFDVTAATLMSIESDHLVLREIPIPPAV